MATSPVEYTIGGVKIHFPCKAYPSQLAMMNSVSDSSTSHFGLAVSLLLYSGSQMHCKMNANQCQFSRGEKTEPNAKE